VRRSGVDVSLGFRAQQPKPNVLFIMGNDIGWTQPPEHARLS
jgi:hypothetical protein